MRLTADRLRQYEHDGFVLVPDVFSRDEIAHLRADVPRVFAEDTPARVAEDRGPIVRSVYGTHRTHDTFRRLSEDARLVEPAMQVVDDDVYIYQFKINAKAAFDGDVWEWHQDYIFWRNEDGMPAPRVTNVALFLDDVTEFNGPMFFIPGSHRQGVIDVQSRDGDRSAVRDTREGWIANVTAKLKYGIDRQTVAELCAAHGIVAPKGPAGSVLLFDANVVHSSPNNISPFSRTMVVVTYNSVHNVALQPGTKRPEFLVSREPAAVRPVHVASPRAGG